MYNLKRRRESVATAYKKTTKFLTSNTANLLKKVPNTRKYRLLAKIVDDHKDSDTHSQDNQSDESSDYGDRELDYYLGVRKKEIYWRDPVGIEQIKKDYLLYHCGVTEEDYKKFYKKTIAKPSYVIQPRLKQVPFKIHRKNKKINIRDSESWCERRNIFKIFANKWDSDSTSDSYSECDDEDENAEVTKCFRRLKLIDDYDLQGVRIKEVSEGRPCDNCPELCPGFISHPWSVRSQAHIKSLSTVKSRCKHASMCLSLKQLEWAEICRRLKKDEPVTEKTLQKFPSRERNHAVRRKSNNNNLRSHVNCEACARVAESER
ncbi:unnamed protein product [Pieris brassicae]|uniref:Uncharacterized protein n=1 Tax=Pieris brassicae TaxID=7116 RepID=A0A9P0SXR6_PIEBR|nr:unnamed protein product [Pieris brassicae]